MTSKISQDCEIAANMARSPVLLVILSLCDLCCIIAIPLLTYWIVRIWKMKLMHFNTRLLVCFHIAWLIVHVTGRALLHTSDLIVYATPFTDGCKIMHTKKQCFVLRLPYNIGMIVSNCSAVFVSLERLIATLNTRKYERGFKSVGFYLLFLQVLLGSSVLSVVYAPTRLDNSPLLYCQTTSTLNFMWTVYPLGFMSVLQIISVLIFEAANKKNRRLSKSQCASNDTLSRRYQIEENLWTIQTLKLFVYTNTAFATTYLIALAVVIFHNGLFSKPIYYSLIEVTNMLYLYALALPLVLWYNRKDVKSQIHSAVLRDVSTSTNRVFEELQLQWNTYAKMKTLASAATKKNSKCGVYGM